MDLETILATYGTIPPLTSYKRPMFVGPHPDDIEFCCGALVSKMRDNNVPVTFVVATDGAAGGAAGLTPSEVKNIREAESRKAAQFLGVENIEFCELEDGGDYSVSDAIRAITPLVLKYKPDIIFAPDPKLKTECHPDHLKVGEAVRRLVKLVPYRESLKRHGINVGGIEEFPDNITLAFYATDDANIIEEVSAKNLEDKISSLMLHESQMQDPSTGLLLQYFRFKAAALGAASSTGLAEDYQVLLPLVQHVYSEGIHYNSK